jgi:CsoR family transcriptional regulator, copper-sensing transcriptional repressor
MADELRIINPDAKRLLIARLGRIEGQIRGLQEMIAQEEDCEQIAQQITAVRSAFNKVFAEMIADELQAVDSLKNLTDEARHARLATLAKVLAKYA